MKNALIILMISFPLLTWLYSNHSDFLIVYGILGQWTLSKVEVTIHCLCMRKSEWMSERASLSMSWFQRTKGLLAWSCSLERGRKRETERGREEPGGILSFLRGLCLDATSWHIHRPKTPTQPHQLPNSGLQTRTATVLKINLYTNRLLIIIN